MTARHYSQQCNDQLVILMCVMTICGNVAAVACVYVCVMTVMAILLCGIVYYCMCNVYVWLSPMTVMVCVCVYCVLCVCVCVCCVLLLLCVWPMAW